MTAAKEKPTVTDLLCARRGDQHAALRFEDREWTWEQYLQEIAELAGLLHELRPANGPFHFGVLLDNVPEFATLLPAAAWSGSVLVGLNPTRRGQALARDVHHTDCGFVITEPRHAELLQGLDLGGARVLVVGSPEWKELRERHRGHQPQPVPARPEDLVMLVFTSGTSGVPKAVRCTHGKIAGPGSMLADRFGLTTQDAAYLAMPLFHSNAVMAGWAVGLSAGATLCLRRRFSASEFLNDVRRFGATYANYVGKPLSYILATPTTSEDADNPLRLIYGNEGAEEDIAAFAERFNCRVVDAFGSTEGGVVIQRTPDTPAGALGVPAPGVSVYDPETQTPCPPAQFDETGQLINATEAIGELVNTAGAGAFAGYYGDAAADAERMRGGIYWSGDLAYRDTDGFCYFAGRSGDWLRVDGENLGTGPIEQILTRHYDVEEVAVYAVPDPVAGDRVMAAVVPGGSSIDPDAFDVFLAEQPDLGPKQWPSYVRVASALPRTPTFKVLKRELAAEGVECTDPVWHRPAGSAAFHRL